MIWAMAKTYAATVGFHTDGYSSTSVKIEVEAATLSPPYQTVKINNDYTFKFNFEGDSIVILMECASEGWCGLGFGKSVMNQSDLVIVQMNQTNAPKIWDAYANGHTPMYNETQDV